MENEILDYFEEEQPNRPIPKKLYQINLVVGILVLLIGCYLVHICYYWYHLPKNTLVPIYYFFTKYDIVALWGISFIWWFSNY